MPVLPDSPGCVPLRADLKEDRLNSRFQHIRKNKSVKAHGVVEEESVIIMDEYHYFRQILVTGKKISTVISSC